MYHEVRKGNTLRIRMSFFYFSSCKQFIFMLGTYSYQWIDERISIASRKKITCLLIDRAKSTEDITRRCRARYECNTRRACAEPCKLRNSTNQSDRSIFFQTFGRKITENRKQSPVKSPNIHFEINMHLKISPNTTNCRAVGIRSLLRT